MGTFPPGAWELPRRNFVHWAIDLDAALPSKGLNDARSRIFTLGGRLDASLRVVMTEEDDDEEDSDDMELVGDSARMPPPPVPKANRKGKKAAPKDEAPVENDPSVSTFAFT
jgi:hypothetical protein